VLALKFDFSDRQTNLPHLQLQNYWNLNVRGLYGRHPCPRLLNLLGAPQGSLQYANRELSRRYVANVRVLGSFMENYDVLMLARLRGT